MNFYSNKDYKAGKVTLPGPQRYHYLWFYRHDMSVLWSKPNIAVWWFVGHFLFVSLAGLLQPFESPQESIVFDYRGL